MEATQRQTWRSTNLWRQLESRDGTVAENLRTIIHVVMPDIETTLAKSGSSPSNFTLHDADHSYRVSEQMAELAGPKLLDQLEPHDLGMLLLSAYLHDIGMTPPIARLDQHLAYLFSGNSSEISDEDVESLRSWLDDEWDGLTPPISPKTPAIPEIRLARRILAGYVRHRHNDWSEDWIRKSFSHMKEPYPGWLDDLIRLCQSHHFDIDQLRSSTFAPRLVGAPGTVLHLRYCACLLRIADVLDFDPERTPGILFAHRDVSQDSAIFWHKDQELSFELEGNHLTLHARPENALIHRAIELTLRDVDAELLLARRLADETNFRHMPGRDEPLPHQWHLDTNIRAVVTPRNDAYEYIDGTFRPDPKKLLELVGGIELYGSHFAAFREILQNAFDAVREQIARERLLKPNPADTALQEQIASLHRVSLTIEKEEDGEGYLAVCKDTGTGMSRSVIHSRFLVGGTSTNHESRALERTCNQYGFSVGRTARFGIGVLSYFILGSHLTVNTRRSLEAGDPDGTGWTFSTDGLDDFGELRASNQDSAGTEIVLSIREEIMNHDVVEFLNNLREYLQATVKRCPCSFEFNAPGFPDLGFTTPPGWAASERESTETMLKPMIWDGVQFGQTPDSLRSPEEKRLLDHRREAYELVRTRAAGALRTKTYELEVGDGLGVARVVVGTFDLAWGLSPAYFGLTPGSENHAILEPFPTGDGGMTGGILAMSWNGMSITASRQGSFRSSPFISNAPVGSIVEIDWTNDEAGRLAVHRNTFTPSSKAQAASEAVFHNIRETQRELVERDDNSRLAYINASILGTSTEDVMPKVWSIVTPDGNDALGEITFPAIDFFSLETEQTDLRWRGERVTPIRPLSINGGAGSRTLTLSWGKKGEPAPTALGATEFQGEIEPIAIWDGRINPISPSGIPMSAASFPPEWQSLASVSLGGNIGLHSELWNADHPLLRAIDEEGWLWVTDTFGEEDFNPLPHRAEVMSSTGRVAAWIVRCFRLGDEELWGALAKRAPDFLNDAWKMALASDEVAEIVRLVDFDEGWMLSAFSSSAAHVYGDRDSRRQFALRFPAPTNEWWLTGPTGERDL